MKKFSAILILAVLTGALHAGAYSGGTGDVTNPYLIATLDDLLELSRTSVDHGAYFFQTQDIDAAASSGLNGGKGFEPIGKIGVSLFFGNYNGNGKAILNLKINRPDEDNVGLFGYVNGAKITRVHLKNATIIGNNFVGGVVGNLWNGSNVTESCLTGGSVEGKQRVGGLVGAIMAEPANVMTTLVSKSSSNAAVKGNDFVGGLIGFSSGRVEKSYAMATAVTAGGGGIGGLVGQLENTATVSECYAAGGTVTGANGYTGGAIGFVPEGFPAANVEKLYWNTERTGQATSAGGGEGKTTAEMVLQATYQGWDFINTWKILANYNENHPILNWEDATSQKENVFDKRKAFFDVKHNALVVCSDKAEDISIFNIHGQKVKTTVVQSGENHVDISGLSTGIYVVSCQGRTFKIIKR